MSDPYYQPVLDALRTNPDAMLEVLRDVCVATESERPAGVLVQKLVAFELKNSALEKIPKEVFFETLVRLMALGNTKDYLALIDWYVPRTPAQRTHEEQVTENWTSVFDLLPFPGPNRPEDELLKRMRENTTALHFVLVTFSAMVIPMVSSRGPRGLSLRYEVLQNGIVRLVRVWMAIHQQLLDRGLAWRKEINSSKLLTLLSIWRNALDQTFNLPNKNADRLVPLRIEVEELRYGKGRVHTYVDAFRAHRLRQIGLTTYERVPEQLEPPGMSTTILELIQFRDKQLAFLLDEYGAYSPSNAGPGAEKAVVDEDARKKVYRIRKELIDRVNQRGAPSDPVSESALATFLCAYFKVLFEKARDLKDPYPRATAWEATMQFFQRLLDTQTFHCKFNLDDKWYFDVKLPRALNGSELFDCGVSAVRMAYILSSLGECYASVSEKPVPTRISFVILPLHVGLIVEIGDLAPFTMHNNTIFLMSPELFNLWKTEWDKTLNKLENDPATEPLRRQKLLEDIAAETFLRDVDFPLRSVPLPTSVAGLTKKQVWSVYIFQVAPKLEAMLKARVNNPTDPAFEFDLGFLGAQDADKEWFDKFVVPFWNVQCHRLWNEFGLQKLQTDVGARSQYADRLEILLDAVEAQYIKDVMPIKDQLNQALKDLDIVGPAAQRVTRSIRLTRPAAGIPPTGQVRTHLDLVRGPLPVTMPPFADPASFLTAHGS